MSAAIINITCSTAYLEEKKRKLIFRKKKSNHIKRKIDVPLEQKMDSNGDDDR
jgi:hypothetical protein